MIKLSLDNKTFSKKPTGDNVKFISNRIANEIENINIEDFANEVSFPKGRTWCPTVFRGGRRLNDNWVEQQVFALDFDNGISIEDCINRCKKYHIMPVFAYNTFSSVNNNKFRVVFVLNHICKDIKLRHLIQLSLMKLFPESDKACKDASRLFYGGKELSHKDYDNKINTVDLVIAVCAFIAENNSDNGNSAREIKNYASLIGVDTQNNYPLVKWVDENNEKYVSNSLTSTDTSISDNNHDGKSFGPIYNIYSCEPKNVNTKKYFIKYSYGKITNTKSNKAKISNNIYGDNNEIIERTEETQRFNFTDLLESCQLYKEFNKGTSWLNHMEIFGILTNFMAIKGGRTKFFDALSREIYHKGDIVQYDENKWKYYANYVNKSNYIPQSCRNFCPHHKTCEHANNMILQAKLKRGKISILNAPILKKLEVAERELENIFEVAQTTLETGKIVCIKAPTGIGKTDHILKIKDALICVPTHQLKNELYNRAKAMGNNVVVTPELPNDLPESIQDTIDKYYKAGAYTQASKFIFQLAKFEKIPQLVKYCDDMQRALESKCTIITTHSKLLHLTTILHENIIIDEDIIINGLVQMNQVKMSDLLVIRNKINWKETPFGDNIMEKLIDKVINAIDGELCELPDYIFNGIDKIYDKIFLNEVESNVLGFLSCDNYIKNTNKETGEIYIEYSIKNAIPLGKRTIISSATLDKKVCESIFKDRLVWMDLGEVENTGTIEQYPQYSFSRYSLKNNQKVLDMAIAVCASTPTITYKSFAHYFDNCVSHFGATKGIDLFNGKNICVVGTPHITEYTYILFAKALGFKCKGLDSNMSYCKIRRNNFEYYFQTYSNNQDLRDIQLYMIESELLQAIGRARILRNDCIVTVLSNLPIPQSKFKYISK